jgi:rare lipoprotein A
MQSNTLNSLPSPVCKKLIFSALCCLGILVSGCSSTGQNTGKYYQDDGPGDRQVDLDSIPNAVPKNEPYVKATLKPYTVMGKRYLPLSSAFGYLAQGEASWYGKKYHGRKTAIGEVYDMYAMTAAHPTLPLPTYVKVTNVKNKKSVVVRVNDRGPFLSNRIIDLS